MSMLSFRKEIDTEEGEANSKSPAIQKSMKWSLSGQDSSSLLNESENKRVLPRYRSEECEAFTCLLRIQVKLRVEAAKVRLVFFNVGQYATQVFQRIIPIRHAHICEDTYESHDALENVYN